MKYPELLEFSALAAHLGEFDAIIDARSPTEFAQDHLPGAINCPVLDDAERAHIGTLYKQVGAFEAKKLGAAWVARNIARHLETRWLDQPRNWRPLVYCWRGGNRSGAMATILAKVGWPVVQLDGGYKAYRQFVVEDLDRLAPSFHYQVVCGTTGSGKSRLLRALHAHGAQVLDLECLAAHRGSVLGGLPDQAQPSQKHFESAIWHRLRSFSSDQVVFVEAESKKIGNLRVPEALMLRMRESECIQLELSDAHRVTLLMQDYAHYAQDGSAFAAQLGCLTQLHGQQKIQAWRTALAANTPSATAEVVHALLREHYDPAYLKSIFKNFRHAHRARSLRLPDIGDADFAQTAQSICTEIGKPRQKSPRDRP